MLVSDHPHLFETGGENYHTDFGAWDYLRGHEDDPWRTRPDPSWIGAPRCCPAQASGWRGYDVSRTWFRDEADFPGPRTMVAAAGWLDRELAPSAAPAERALLVVDEFDPHEPFDTPEPWASRYDPDWEGERIIWPPYAAGTPTGADSVRRLTEREGRHLRAQYGAKLSMIDHWLGRILDVVDRHDAWDTTAFILCTDHGHYLGERGHLGQAAGRRATPSSGHIPLLVAWPAWPPAPTDALTTTVDLHATLCDVFGVTPEHRTHGQSLVPLLEADGDIDPRVGAVRRVGPRGARRRRHPHLRQGAGRRQPAAVDVLEPLVDDADPRAAAAAGSCGPTSGPGSIASRAPTCR